MMPRPPGAAAALARCRAQPRASLCRTEMCSRERPLRPSISFFYPRPQRVPLAPLLRPPPLSSSLSNKRQPAPRGPLPQRAARHETNELTQPDAPSASAAAATLMPYPAFPSWAPHGPTPCFDYPQTLNCPGPRTAPSARPPSRPAKIEIVSHRPRRALAHGAAPACAPATSRPCNTDRAHARAGISAGAASLQGAPAGRSIARAGTGSMPGAPASQRHQPAASTTRTAALDPGEPGSTAAGSSAPSAAPALSSPPRSARRARGAALLSAPERNKAPPRRQASAQLSPANRPCEEPSDQGSSTKAPRDGRRASFMSKTCGVATEREGRPGGSKGKRSDDKCLRNTPGFRPPRQLHVRPAGGGG